MEQAQSELYPGRRYFYFIVSVVGTANMKTLIFLGVLLLYSTYHGTSANECKKKLHHLAACQKEYIGCSTSNAVPVQLCMGCQQEHALMQEAYSNLTQNPNCSKQYLDHDRINVVETTQNMLLGLWKKAHCDDCLKSNNSEIFENKMSDLQHCFDNNADKCTKCIIQYLNLNDFYTSLDQKNNGQVCYDLQDAMNQTRVYWSKELKCCQRTFRMTYFLIATIGIGALPVIFYSSAYILTKRRERNHAVIHIEENINHSRHINDRTSTAIPPPNVQTVEPSSEYAAMLNNNMHKDMDDLSDDENMPKMQKLTE